MSFLINRKEILEKLEEINAFSNIALVSGIKGVGKTTLVNQWA